MNQTNGTCVLIDQEDRAAVGHINTQANITLIRNHPIVTFEALVPGRRRIDHRNSVAVNLAGSNKFSINQPKNTSGFAMHLVEIFQHGNLIR